jgi:hypothetical protein
VAAADRVSPRVDFVRVPFDELVQARYRAMAQAMRPDTSDASHEYGEIRRRFEKCEGRIVEAFWGVSCPSGIALTRKPVFRIGRLSLSRTRLHRWTDLSTREYPHAAAELYRGDNLAHRCEEVLRCSTQRISLGRVFGAMSSLLSVIEVLHGEEPEEAIADTSSNPREAGQAAGKKRHAAEKKRHAESQRTQDLAKAIDSYREDLVDAAAYYQESAARSAHIFYFWGMLLGVFAIALLSSLVVVLVHHLIANSEIQVTSTSYAYAIATVSAGALGACVSVMWRMSSGDFHSDYEAGSGHLRMIGSFRPFIGAIFGLALYFTIMGRVLPVEHDPTANFYLVTFIAFLGGFSERLAPDVFGQAESGLRARRGEASQPTSPQQRPLSKAVIPRESWGNPNDPVAGAAGS